MPGTLFKGCYFGLSLLVLVYVLTSTWTMAQSAAFSYQGRLTDADNPAVGVHEMQFKLFDTATVGTGTQQGSTFTDSAVQVTNGVFTVQLDFGAGVFDGSARYLEIAIRPAGSTDPFIVLSPRQPISSSPYAVRSTTAGSADNAINAGQLGGMSPSGFIQNSISQQPATSFNIGGTGAATIFNATTQFNLNGNRILANAGTDNLFAGVGTGASNTTGGANSLFGANAGLSNTTGGFNSFFGTNAGRSNTTAIGNAFFGTSAGFNNSTGQLNTFVGEGTGSANTSGSGNTFIGRDADFTIANPTGDNNTLLGTNAKVASGVSNSTAIGAGVIVSTSNTILLGNGDQTVKVPGSLEITNNFSAPFLSTTQLRIGGFPVVTAPGTDNIFVGAGAGPSNTAGSANSFVGRSAGFNNTTGQLNAFFGEGAGSANTTGSGNTFIGRDADFGIANPTGDNNTLLGAGARVSSGVNNSTAIGSSATVSQSNTIVLGTTNQKTLVEGRFRTGIPFGTSGADLPGRGYMETFFQTSTFQGIYTPNVIFGSYANNPRGTVDPCVLFQGIPGITAGVILTNCISGMSSVNDKTDVRPFTGGLDIINRLKPVAFKHKENGKPGIGLNTEDVAAVDSSLIVSDDKISLEKVNESSLNVLLIDAVKQQQAQIEAQQQQIDALKRLVCASNPTADVCLEKGPPK